MGKNQWAWVMVACSVVGCGQDLALPDGYGKPAASGGDGPADGVTGLSGSGGAAGSGTSAPTNAPPSSSKGGTASEPRAGADAGGASSADAGVGGGGSDAAGAGGDAGEVVVPVAQLLFSEYVEGLKSNKALELYALQGGVLEGCELQTFFNGKIEPSKLALQGELMTGQTYVLCSSDLGKSEFCNRSTNLTFNGDDALALVCEGVVQDIIGEIGVDPGESWGMGATLDHTLQRRCEVTAGRRDPATPFVIDAEWVLFGADTFSDLGQRSCGSVSRSTP